MVGTRFKGHFLLLCALATCVLLLVLYSIGNKPRTMFAVVPRQPQPQPLVSSSAYGRYVHGSPDHLAPGDYDAKITKEYLPGNLTAAAAAAAASPSSSSSSAAAAATGDTGASVSDLGKRTAFQKYDNGSTSSQADFTSSSVTTTPSSTHDNNTLKNTSPIRAKNTFKKTSPVLDTNTLKNTSPIRAKNTQTKANDGRRRHTPEAKTAHNGAAAVSLKQVGRGQSRRGKDSPETSSNITTAATTTTTTTTTTATATPEPCPCSPDLEKKQVKDEKAEMMMAKGIETDERAVLGFFRENGLHVKYGAGTRREFLDREFEAPLFHFPALAHARCLPDHTRSQVHLLTQADHLSVGSTVQFRVDLYNGCGQPRSVGGDEIRVWLRSQENDKSALAAKVKDMGNGSYMAESVLPWSGVTVVRASLTYARDYLRACVALYHSIHSLRWTTETMKNRNYTEKVPCLPSQPIPGYHKVCNFTSANGGHPWFCGHPTLPGLTCGHRSSYGNLMFQPIRFPGPLKAYVDTLNKCCKGEREDNPDFRLIKNDIHLNATYDKADPRRNALKEDLPPCSRTAVRESWGGSSSPQGWFLGGSWRPSSCRLPPLTADTVQRCLARKTLLLLGDSNQRYLWEGLVPLVNCTKKTVTTRNSPHICQNDGWSSTVIFASHALPFSPGVYGQFPYANLPLASALHLARNLSYHGNSHYVSNAGGGDVIVVLHYYLHLSLSPVHVYRSFVRAELDSVREYLNLYPKARFLVRGPHVTNDGNAFHGNIGDKFAPWYQRIWRQEIQRAAGNGDVPLVDRVRYLDFWDFSIASENQHLHPEPMIPEILRVVLGYACDFD